MVEFLIFRLLSCHCWCRRFKMISQPRLSHQKDVAFEGLSLEQHLLMLQP